MRHIRAEKEFFDRLYEKYNRREYVHPDPLEFLYRYEDVADREIVALVASSLAYGRVEQILKSVSRVLAHMPSPRHFVMASSPYSLQRTFSDFRHRFSTGQELAALLFGTGQIIKRYGSLQMCFLSGFQKGDHSLPALSAFAGRLLLASNLRRSSLIPSPAGGSAMKRLNLFLRWMVRHDDVDPGGWDGLPPSALIVPLDVHIHRIGLALGFTERRQADMRTAMEITATFKEICPQDPVKYDFALTRPGIWKIAGFDRAPVLTDKAAEEAKQHV